MKRILNWIIRRFRLDCEWRIGTACYVDEEDIYRCDRHYRLCFLYRPRRLR